MCMWEGIYGNVEFLSTGSEPELIPKTIRGRPMPKQFDELRRKIAASLKGKTNPRTKKPYSESDIFAIATAAWKKQHGGKTPRREDFVELLKEIQPDFDIVEYAVPINYVEETEGNKEFIVQGIAIEETTSRNDIKYTAEELEKAAPTLNGRAILDSHNQESVKSILGRVSESKFDSGKKNVSFKAKIMDEQTKQMIKDGRIKEVSVGARVKEFLEEAVNDVKVRVAKGIEFLELSFVAVPGVLNAGLTGVIREKFDFLDKVEEEYKSLEEETTMELEELKTELASFKEELKKEFGEAKKSVPASSMGDEDLRKENEKLKQKLEAIEKAKKEELVSKVIEAEKLAGMIKEEEIEDEKKSLNSLPAESLEYLLKKASSVKKESTEGFADKSKSVVTEPSDGNYLVLERTREGVSIWGKNRDPKTGRYILS